MAKREVNLYGALKKYGPKLELEIATPVEAFRALFANFPETRNLVKSGEFKIVVGNRTTGKVIGEEELGFKGTKPLHIVPVVKGRGGGRNAGKIVLGAAIVAAAFYFAPMAYAGADAAFMQAAGVANYTNLGATAFTAPLIGGVSYGTIASVGLTMALTGAYQALSPTPKAQEYGSRESPDQRPSFLYNGPVNTVEQGSALPLVYGQMRTGSVLVSAGVSVEQI